MDPYLAGVGIGLVLLAAYVVAGRRLGASGGFSIVVAAGTAAVRGTDVASASAAVAPYLTSGVTSPLTDWLVLELVGAVIGGFISASLAGRLRMTVDRGEAVAAGTRVYFAMGGGMLMGFGAKLARG